MQNRRKTLIKKKPLQFLILFGKNKSKFSKVVRDNNNAKKVLRFFF